MRGCSQAGGVLKETAYEGLTVHAEPWERESCFARLDKWLPKADLLKFSEEEAQKRLFTKYLRGYGPATQQDFCLWSGLVAGDAKKAIENASSSLQQVGIEGTKGQFWLLKEDLRRLDSIDPSEPAPPRLLPKFDSILLGHKDRSRIVKDEHKKYVFKPKAGDIAATVLVDGQVVGTWRHKRKRRTLVVAIKPFGKMPKNDLAEVEQQARELSQYVGAEELDFSIAS